MTTPVTNRASWPARKRRRDGVDPDASRGQLDRQRPGQVDDGALGRVVDGRARVPTEAGDRGDVDDAPAPVDEVRQCGLGDEHDRLDVDRHHLPPLGDPHIGERHGAGDASVVDEHIETPEGLHGGRDPGPV
jgi:hypothetical protein